MTAIITTILILAGEETSGEIALAAAGILVFGMTWSLLGGWTYLLAVVRSRGKIGRGECLVLGIGLMDMLPLALLALVGALSGRQAMEEMYGSPGSSVIATTALMLSVIGLLAGWLFWRVGVRPAPVPEPDVSAVFA